MCSALWLLSSLWLSDHEGSLFLSCFQYPRSSVSSLARISWLARSTVHDTIQRLLNLWYLVEEQQWSRRLFSAVELDVIKAMLFSQQKELDKRMKEIDSHQHLFQELRLPYSSIPQVLYHTWDDVIAVLYSRIKKSSSIYWFFDIEEVIRVSHYGLEDLIANISDSDVSSRELIPPSPIADKYLQAVHNDRNQVKIISDIWYAGSMSDHIIIDQSYFYIWYEPNRVVWIEVVHPGFVQMQKLLFDSLWDRL